MSITDKLLDRLENAYRARAHMECELEEASRKNYKLSDELYNLKTASNNQQQYKPVDRQVFSSLLTLFIDHGRGCPPRKIDMIKRLRDITGWGLKESKDFVEELLAPEVYPYNGASLGDILRDATSK